MENPKLSLLSILDAPSNPKENSHLDWTVPKTKIRFIPGDYKEFVQAYGTGTIDGFLWVLNPFSTNQNLSWDASFELIEIYQNFGRSFPDLERRPAYPKEGSFFPWAITDNGDSFFWVVDDVSDDWVVGIHSPDQTEEEIYDFNMTTFLYKLLNEDIQSKILPSTWPPKSHSFTPWQKHPSET